jgi:hypothetical protein
MEKTFGYYVLETFVGQIVIFFLVGGGLGFLLGLVGV